MTRAGVVLSVVLASLLVFSSVGYACTIVAVGNKATVDGSTIITHNDDSSVADFRLKIVPEQDWPEVPPGLLLWTPTLLRVARWWA